MDAKILAGVVCVSGVSLMVGYLLMGNMEIASMPIIANSSISDSGEVVLGGFGNAATYLATGVGILALVFIVATISATLNKRE